jgi:penicillin amidase
VVVGHNQHIAWGFTNLGADVQDVYIEQLSGGDSPQFRAADGSMRPVQRVHEIIRVKHGSDVGFDLLLTEHGGDPTPIISNLIPGETRSLALRWTLYDARLLKIPFFEVDSAHDWPSFLAAFSTFGGPAQNVVYADDQGHIGYHAIGAVPLRGPAAISASAARAVELPTDLANPANSQSSAVSPTIAKTPGPLASTDIQAPPATTAAMLSGPLSPVPVTPDPAHEWSGYIPFDRLPAVFDPPGGVIATANARTAPDDYPYPITLDWAAPYRNERIWRLLSHRSGLTTADMLAIQTDVYSDFDHVLAERLAYALDHSQALAGGQYSKSDTRRLHQAADLLRTFNGRMNVDSPAAAVTFSAHQLLPSALLAPQLEPARAGKRPDTAAQLQTLGQLYRWDEQDYALEQILMHTPPRWLPASFASWSDFLTDLVARSLVQAKAPGDLAKWRYGSMHTVEVSDAILGQSAPLRGLYGRPVGTGDRPLSGDTETIKQVGHAFGPSERLTVDLADPDRTTLNVTMGQSGNPGSPFFLDQFPLWLRGTTLPFVYSEAAAQSAATHTLTLAP